MFNTFANQFIDQVVIAKKAVVDTVVPSKEVKSILNDFVDAQAQYTREAVKAGADVFTRSVELATDRTPYVEAAKTLSKYFPAAACAVPSKKKV
jgi:acyl carrier protein phosphodiesterase